MTRQEWCVALAALVSPSFPKDAAERLVRMLPNMADLPDWVFTERTLRVVASTPSRQTVPSLAEITTALRPFLAQAAWNHENRALPGPIGRPLPTDEERAALQRSADAWRAEMAAKKAEVIAEEDAKLPDVTIPAMQARHRARVAKLNGRVGEMIAGSVRGEMALTIRPLWTQRQLDEWVKAHGAKYGLAPEREPEEAYADMEPVG